MAAGLPVVNTRLDSGVPYVSPHEQTGLRFLPRIPGRCGINRLLDDPGLRRLFGETARAPARQEFSVDRMAGRTLNVYRQALRPGAHQAGHNLTLEATARLLPG